MMVEQHIAGDTLDFLDTVDQYPPADGWTLKYQLVPRFTTPTQTPITITATTSGADYRVQAAASVTAGWKPGFYAWSRWVEKAGPIRQSLGSGQLQVLQDPATAAAGYDGRSIARKAYDDALAAYSTFVSSGGRIKSYTIGIRTVVYDDTRQILKDIAFWKAQVEEEENAAKIAAGLPTGNRVLVRMP